jgi:hypothetical protein
LKYDHHHDINDGRSRRKMMVTFLPLKARMQETSDNFAAVMNKCTFVISACMQTKRRNDQVVIIKLDLDHSCGCMLRPGAMVSVGTSFITAQSRRLLKDVPNAAPPVNIQAHVHRCHGAHANYIMTAHRAKK